MRGISTYDATACERAEAKSCHCRCGGQLHGVSHHGYIQDEREFVEEKGNEALTSEVVDRLVKKALERGDHGSRISKRAQSEKPAETPTKRSPGRPRKSAVPNIRSKAGKDAIRRMVAAQR